MLLVEPSKLEGRSSSRTVGGEIGDLIASRLPFLSESDQLLIEMLYKHNLSRRQIGRLIKKSPGAVSRRLRALVNRLHDPIVVALTQKVCTLSREHREVGVQYFLQDASVPILMRRTRRSRREVEAMIEFVRGWHRGISGKS